MNISQENSSSDGRTFADKHHFQNSLQRIAQLHSPLSKIVEAWTREGVRIVVDPLRLKTNARVHPNDPVIDSLPIHPRFTLFLKVG